MIGYKISRADLEELIRLHDDGWLAAAKVRTKTFEDQGFYQEPSTIWSRIKKVYMDLQGGSKCAYCERQMESSEIGAGEQDVEHFRPKSSIKAWTLPESLKNIPMAPIPPPDSDAREVGYYLLPYDPFNYCASCKPCNSALKSNYFPVALQHDIKGKKPEDLVGERPYLIYPIGDFDDNPAELIKFNGVSPYTASADPFKNQRALVTIAFFELDRRGRRDNLYLQRATIITQLFVHLDTVAKDDDPFAVQMARDEIALAIHPTAPHSNCAQSFVDLYNENRNVALDFALDALKLRKSKSSGEKKDPVT